MPHRSRALLAAASALLAGAAFTPAIAPATAEAQIAVSFNAAIDVGFPPPPLPIYDQPPLPEPGWIWIPGHWAWDPVAWDYYWVPGYWVEPPAIGLLWTPGWWDWDDGFYVWNAGYWAPEVGYYGGVDYGYGYNGVGYYGGYWREGHFFYNRAVTNVVGVGNYPYLYSRAAPQVVRTRASFYGPGGTNVRPDPQQTAVARMRHVPATAIQRRQTRLAAADPRLRATVNHGAPAIAATQRPGAFAGAGVVGTARAGGAFRPPPEAGKGEAAGRAAEVARIRAAPAAHARMTQAPARATPGRAASAARVARLGEGRMAAARTARTYAPAPVERRAAPARLAARAPARATPRPTHASARAFERGAVTPRRFAARGGPTRPFAAREAAPRFAMRPPARRAFESRAATGRFAMRAPAQRAFAGHAATPGFAMRAPAPRTFVGHAPAPRAMAAHGVPTAARVAARPKRN